MDQYNKSRKFFIGTLLFFTGLLSGLIIWFFDKQKTKRDQQKLIQHNQDLHRQINTIKNQPALSPKNKPLHGKERKRTFFSLLILILAGVSPLLVMLDRWFELNPHLIVVNRLTAKIPFFSDIGFPGYILVIVLSSLIGLILFVFLTPKINLPFIFQSNKPTPISSMLPGWQILASKILSYLTLSAITLEFIGFFFFQRQPGVEYPAIVFIFILSSVFLKIPLTWLWSKFKSMPSWLVPVLLLFLSMLLLALNLNEKQSFLWVSLLFFILSIYLTIPHLKQIPVVIWICLGAVILYTFQINSWRYAIIGDEYSFHSYSNFVLNEGAFKYSLQNLLNPETVIYGKFVYLSVLPNILSMALFGAKNFGWRIVNPILVITSLPFFYLFFKQFLGKKVALIFSILFISSHYLINFSKIGYNNLSALWMMALFLWITGITLKYSNCITYSVLGLVLGIGLYMYPTVYAVLPIPILFLIGYNPPWASARSRKQWFSLIAMFSVLFIPLLFEQNYWQNKWGESILFLENGNGPINHFFKNLFYIIFSPLIAPQESHFVVSSYLDPISGLLMLLGIGWVIKNLKRDRFYSILFASIFITGLVLTTTRSRSVPGIPHMFLLLPFFIVLAALGLYWILYHSPIRPLSIRSARWWVTICLILVFAANLVQAFWVSSNRSDQYYSHESLILRLIDEIQRQGNNRDPKDAQYLFITDANWNIEGHRNMQEIYQLPLSGSQLHRSPVYSKGNEPNLPYQPVWVTLPEPSKSSDNNPSISMRLEHWVIEMIKNEHTIVIAPPFLSVAEFERLEGYLNQMDRKTCELKAAPWGETRVTVWFSSQWQFYCPENGSWNYYW